jgi:hypothetical protein
LTIVNILPPPLEFQNTADGKKRSRAGTAPTASLIHVCWVGSNSTSRLRIESAWVSGRRGRLPCLQYSVQLLVPNIIFGVSYGHSALLGWAVRITCRTVHAWNWSAMSQLRRHACR